MEYISKQFFREEAVQAGREEWLGRPLLSRPLFAVVWTIISVAILLGVTSGLALGHYTRQIQLSGSIVHTSGLITISAHTFGKISDKYIRDGQIVHEGDLLYSVNNERTIKRGPSFALISKELQNELTKVESLIQLRTAEGARNSEELASRIKEKKQELIKLGELVNTHREYTKLYNQARLRQRDIVERGLAVEQSYIERENDHHASVIELTSAEKSYIQLTNEIEELQRSLVRIPIETRHDKLTLEREAAKIRQQVITAEQNAGTEVSAPVNGVISGPLKNVGEIIEPSDILATIIPEKGQLAINLEGESDKIGLLKVGTNVLIRFDSFPYQRFGQYLTTIEAISAVPSSLPSANQSSKMKYIIRLALPNRQFSHQSVQFTVRPGMTVKGYALVERRPLYEWLILPLFEKVNGPVIKSRNTDMQR